MRWSIGLLAFAWVLAADDEGHELREGNLTVRVRGVDEATWRTLHDMLRDQLTLAGSSAASEPLADDVAFFTRQHYVRDGWPDAEVSWELRQGVIFLNVRAGRLIRLGQVSWQGDLILPEEELRKFLLRPSLEREGADKHHPVWVDGELQSGAGLVQRRLRAEGYLQAAVTLEPAAEVDADGLRHLKVIVKPGPTFQFGRVSFHGAPPELEASMQAELASAVGGPFNEARVQQLENRLTSLAVEQGWLLAETQSEYRLGDDGGAVDVSLTLQAGERVRVAQVVPHEAFSRGSQRVLRAGFREAEGRYYSADELDLMFRRALDTGMFARLDVEPQVISGAVPPQADLKLSGEETKPKTLGFEIGFDTFLGPQAGVSYRNTNLADTGNTLAAELNWSTAGPLGSVKVTNPAIFDSAYAGSVQLAVENFDLFEYSRYGTRLNLELVRRVSIPFSYTLFAGTSVNTVSTGALSDDEIGPDLYTLAFAGVSFMLDFRDSPVLPRKGWFVNARLETAVDAMGSNVSYLRTDLRGAWFRPLTKKWRFAVGAGLLNIQGATAEALPIDSRVFNGGPNSVRSFAERELGPVTSGGTPLGGTSALMASAELSYEIYPNLELAFFGDIGSLGRGRNSSPFDYSNDFRSALGLGLRYRLPFGPVRVDYGHNMDRRSGEGTGMLHVTVGFAF